MESKIVAYDTEISEQLRIITERFALPVAGMGSC